MDQCPGNPIPGNQQPQKYKYVVYANGTDCDGFNSSEEHLFVNKFEAELFADDCNQGSDGLKYEVATIQEYNI